MNRAERCRLSTSTATLTATSTSPGKSKERQKEGKDRETRITNGHLFTSITVSGNTLCYACNKSIITKEAFACPSCSVTIHKTCKDVLSSCTKVKQKQLKAAQAKNNSALHNVSMRHRGPLGRERPNSAVYPSDNLRQSPLFPQLGSRRPRTPFSSLSKSVSTNNIGNLNDDMPLGIRKILSQSTDSLNSRNRSLSIESLIDEGAEMIFQQLMGDLETDKDFAADSWSLAVEAGFLQQQRKDIMKRQDVIYELIQTEVHHVRTLKIMSDIFRRGMVEDLQMEPATAAALFPALDPLLSTHSRFLASLLERRRTSLQPGSSTNFVIAKLGDILLAQFSGKNGDVMRKAYTEFCSRHTKAVKLYKELFTRDKRFQQFVRRMTRCSVLRRHGIQECILLVTQRITKYPVLIERILHNTKGSDTEEVEDLSRALSLVRALIAGVDGEVHESERRCRLQDVCARLDPRASATMHSGQPFQRHHLLQRRLLHDGLVLWKTATGRFKDVQILLLTDVLIFLQEKDQRYSFPTLDNKPAVIPLQKLIVRDIANQEKGMFLISAAAPVPEMYEIHTASLQDRTAWIRVIQRTVNVCPEMEDFSLEIKTKEMLQELSDELRECDGRLLEQLEVKAGLLRRMLALPGSPETPPTAPGPPLLHADTGDPPQAVPLLTLALRQVQSLAELMVGVCGSGGQLLPGYSTEPTPGPLAPGGTDNTGAAPGGSSPDAERPSVNGGPHTGRRETSNITRDGNGNPLKSHNEDVLQRLSQISNLLLSLQAVVVRQDSLLEDQRRRLCERREGPLVGEAERGPGQDHQREELEGLRRQHGLLQQELQRSRRTCDERGLELRALQDRLQQQQQQQQAQGPGDQPRPELEPGHVQVKRRAHSRQFSLPSAPVLAPTQTKVQRRRSADETILGLGLELSGTWAGLADRPPGPLAEEGRGPQGSAGPTTLDEESESESTSSGEESAGDGERLQNVPEDAEPDPGQPAPEGSGSLQPAAEDDDDDYY